MKKNIFVALDFNSLEKALDITNKLKDHVAGIKITNELFAICGKEGLKKFSELGVDIFLDWKLHDTPNTVKKTVATIESLKSVKYLTIHTSGDFEMLKAAQEAAGSMELLGVTVLTSQSTVPGLKTSVNDQINNLKVLDYELQSGGKLRKKTRQRTGFSEAHAKSKCRLETDFKVA